MLMQNAEQQGGDVVPPAVSGKAQYSVPCGLHVVVVVVVVVVDVVVVVGSGTHI